MIQQVVMKYLIFAHNQTICYPSDGGQRPNRKPADALFSWQAAQRLLIEKANANVYAAVIAHDPVTSALSSMSTSTSMSSPRLRANERG
jgi:hypothetical protein